MVNFPANTPKDVTTFCEDCKDINQAVSKLQEKTSLFIKFFGTACQDENWMKNNTELTEGMATHLNKLAKDGNLNLPQARMVSAIANLASQRLQLASLQELGSDDVTLKSGADQEKINHTILYAASPYFARMFEGGLSEATSKVVDMQDIDPGTLHALKEFLETGSISTMTQELLNKLVVVSDEFDLPDLLSYLAKNHTSKLLEACQEFDQQELLIYLAENHISKENLRVFVEFSQSKLLEVFQKYEKQEKSMTSVDLAQMDLYLKIRSECFRFVESQFPGIKISSTGVKDLHIEINNNINDRKSFEALLLPFFNASNKAASTVPADFSVSVKLGDEATENALNAALAIPFKKLSLSDQLVTNDSLARIARERKNIEELQCYIAHERGSPGGNLRNEGGSQSVNLTQGFAALASECRNLTSLELLPVQRYGPFDTLELTLDKDQVSTLIANNSRLKRINLANSLTDEHLQQLALTHPGLTSISLMHCNVSDEMLHQFSQGCPKIETFELGWIGKIKDATLKRMVDNWPNLKNLTVAICFNLSSDSIEYAIQRCPLVSLVALPGEHQFENEGDGGSGPFPPLITTRTLELLVERHPHLKRLIIDRRYDMADSTPALLKIAQNCHDLEVLDLHVMEIPSEPISSILQNNRNLSKLTLRRNQGPPGQPLLSAIALPLLQTHPTLSSLNIEDPVHDPTITPDLPNIDVKVRRGPG